jgi:hypothetical protein
MLALLSLIPGIGTVIQSVLGAVFDAKVKITQAKTGADRDTAVALLKAAEVEAHERTAALAIIASNKFLTFLVIAFAAPYIVFEFKVVIWDIVLGLGSTDPIKGQVADWATVIIPSIFGSTGATTLGKMWFSRKGQ